MISDCFPIRIASVKPFIYGPVNCSDSIIILSPGNCNTVLPFQVQHLFFHLFKGPDHKDFIWRHAAARSMLSNFACSESDLDVRTIGTRAPRIIDATLAFAKNTSDL